MSDDKVREEFEVDYDAGVIYSLERTSSIQFEDIYKQRAWAAWQASRASLVVELPTEYVLPPTMDVQTLANACRDQDAAAIEAAGVRVKP